MQTGPTVELPLPGMMRCLSLLGHHPSAMDFLGLSEDSGRLCRVGLHNYFFNSVKAPDWFGWGRPVSAPCDGAIVRMGEGWPDRIHLNFFREFVASYVKSHRFRPDLQNSVVDLRPNAGNYVMIRADAGFAVLLAHLRSGSVRVSKNQRVRTGDAIGEMGCSGNSTAPHLHLNLFDQVDDLASASVIAFRLRRFEVGTKCGWKTLDNAMPRSGQRIRRVMANF